MWWYDLKKYTWGNCWSYAKLNALFKGMVEGFGTQMISSAKNMEPCDLKTRMEDLGAAVLPLVEPSDKILKKILKWDFMDLHCLGADQQTATETQMAGFKAVFEEEFKDEAAAVLTGVKDVSELLHLTLQAALDELDAYSDKYVKDMQPDFVGKMALYPKLHILAGNGMEADWIVVHHSSK